MGIRDEHDFKSTAPGRGRAAAESRDRAAPRGCHGRDLFRTTASSWLDPVEPRVEPATGRGRRFLVPGLGSLSRRNAPGGVRVRSSGARSRGRRGQNPLGRERPSLSALSLSAPYCSGPRRPGPFLFSFPCLRPRSFPFLPPSRFPGPCSFLLLRPFPRPLPRPFPRPRPRDSFGPGDANSGGGLDRFRQTQERGHAGSYSAPIGRR